MESAGCTDRRKSCRGCHVAPRIRGGQDKEKSAGSFRYLSLREKVSESDTALPSRTWIPICWCLPSLLGFAAFTLSFPIDRTVPFRPHLNIAEMLAMWFVFITPIATLIDHQHDQLQEQDSPKGEMAHVDGHCAESLREFGCCSRYVWIKRGLSLRIFAGDAIKNISHSRAIFLWSDDRRFFVAATADLQESLWGVAGRINFLSQREWQNGIFTTMNDENRAG